MTGIVLDTSELLDAKRKNDEMLKKIQDLEKENQCLRENCERIKNESNLDKFKSQLLVEMVLIIMLQFKNV